MPAPQNKTDKKSMRIAKFMAAAGLCSRREAERWIEDGHVKVNGEKIVSPALNVTDNDSVIVKGKSIQISKSKPRIFRLNKPRGYLCTNSDPEGRKTIFDLIPKGLPRLISVGRLDLDSEGIILLTDTPSLANELMKPTSKIKRVYRVRIDGNLSADQTRSLEKGIKYEGIQYGPIKVEIEGEKSGRNSWVILTLTEGKNREIRNVMRALGLNVSRLKRISYGGFELGKIPKSLVDEVPYAASKAILKGMDITI